MGSHAAERLLRDGHSVRIFDKLNVDEANIAAFRDRVSLMTGDFTNAADVESALKDIDTVFHFVGTTLPQSSTENPAYDIETNVMASVRLLDACVKNGVKRIMFSSSGGTVYGIPRQTPIPEEHANDPICSYGITKLAVEKYIALYHRLHGMDYRIIRFANPYGPRQKTHASQGAVAVFLGNVLANHPITVWGDGAVRRDYVFIDDAIDACVRLTVADNQPGIYNVGSGKSTSVNELLDAIKSVVGSLPEVRHTPGRKIDVPENVLDISKIRSAITWSPSVSLREGVARTWKWLQESGAKQ